MSRVVFLDYDGVVNRCMWEVTDGRPVRHFGYPEDGRVNDLQAVQWVSEFCERYGFDIVVTSTWRKYPEWEACLRNAGLRDSVRILGATPLPVRARAEEIGDYLKAHPEIEAYLIFDDKAEPAAGGSAAYAEHLVLCDATRGFGEREYEEAVERRERAGR